MHASQKVDVRDILDCDYKLIAEITGTAVLPDEKSFSSKTESKYPCFYPCSVIIVSGLIFRISTETVRCDVEKI